MRSDRPSEERLPGCARRAFLGLARSPFRTPKRRAGVHSPGVNTNFAGGNVPHLPALPPTIPPRWTLAGGFSFPRMPRTRPRDAFGKSPLTPRRTSHRAASRIPSPPWQANHWRAFRQAGRTHTAEATPGEQGGAFWRESSPSPASGPRRTRVLPLIPFASKRSRKPAIPGFPFRFPATSPALPMDQDPEFFLADRQAVSSPPSTLADSPARQVSTCIYRSARGIPRRAVAETAARNLNTEATNPGAETNENQVPSFGYPGAS